MISNDQLGPFCAELAELVGMDGVLPMNTGAEAVETAIKASRRWAYERRGIPADEAVIVVADGNFHGRTTTIVGFSTDPEARRGFGPFTPGFVGVPFGDLDALRAVLDGHRGRGARRAGAGRSGRDRAAGGVPARPARDVRSGRRAAGARRDPVRAGPDGHDALACDHEGIRPDVLLLGKALGGGIVPLSAMVARRDVIDVFTPGSHGSTFGGNPLACAIGREVVAMLRTGEPQRRAAELGTVLRDALRRAASMSRRCARGACGPASTSPTACRPARAACEALASRRVLVKDTHEHTLRIAPPFVITGDELRWAVDQLRSVLAELCP